jgi:hypothetical protein
VLPLGAEKWMTLPSDLNIFTSSMAWIGCTFIFFKVVCNFLSSVPVLLWTFFTFLRGVPLPLHASVSQVSSLCRRLIFRFHGLKFAMDVEVKDILTLHMN